MRMLRLTTWLVLSATFIAPVSDAAALIPLRVAVHVDTSVSHGTRTTTFAGIPIKRTDGEMPQAVEDIVRIAKAEGLDAVILADRARAEVSYGLTRFSRLFKLTVSEGSIRSYGAKRYLERVLDAEGRSEVLVIPGAECMPYYRWSGDPFRGLKLSHAYEHMVLAPLDTPEAVEGIPDTAGGYGCRFSWTVLLNLIPIAMLALGVRLRRRKHKPRKTVGGVLIVLGVLILIDCAPFLPRRISAYDDPTLYPPDVLSGYAASRGGLAFWAHPSANPGVLPEELKRASGIDVEVRPYRDVLLRTQRYDGFAMFNAGIATGMPGGEWDQVLAEYCAGKRARPVWVLSECDFDAHSPPRELAEAQTVVWARARTKEAILDALRRGRCYATLTKCHKSLSDVEWTLSDGKVTARSGDTLDTAAAAVRFRIRMTSTLAPSRNKRMNVKLVVNGQARTILLTPSADGTELSASGAIVPASEYGILTSVRALVCDNGEAVLAVNPIFVTSHKR